MDIRPSWTDEAILTEIGGRLGTARLARDMTQADLAREAGVSKRTVERMEAGEPVHLTSFVRLLRALHLLGGLEALLPSARPGPMDLLRAGGRPPRRASGRDTGPSGIWAWGEEDR